VGFYQAMTVAKTDRCHPAEPAAATPAAALGVSPRSRRSAGGDDHRTIGGIDRANRKRWQSDQIAREGHLGRGLSEFKHQS
jgi:hypothetical protein